MSKVTIIVGGYAIIMSALVLCSIYKGYLHFHYINWKKFRNPKAAYAESFVPWGQSSILNQALIFPFMPQKFGNESEEQSALYRRLKLFFGILVGLYIVAFSPILLVVFFGSTN